VPVDRACYRYRYAVLDRVGNEALYTSADVKVVATPPAAPALSVTAPTNAFWNPGEARVWYRPAATAGSFTVNASSSDAAAGIARYDFPSLPSGWTRSVGTTSATYAWSAANPTAPASALAVQAVSHAGSAASSSFSVAPDAVAPSGGSVAYPTGARSSTSVSVTFAPGTDASSGINLAAVHVLRRTAPLVNGTCGSFGATEVVAFDAVSPYTDTGLVSGTCYQYDLRVADNVGNLVTYVGSGVLKVDNEGPVQNLAVTSALNAFLDGADLYYRGGAAGSFRITDTATDASGVASVTFPAAAATGFTHNAETVTTSTSGAYLSSTFSFTSTATAPGLRAITAADAVGNASTANVTIVRDALPPAGGYVDYPDAVLSAPSVPVSTSAGADAGSGVDLASASVKRATATYTASSGTCGAFGTYSAVALTGGADTTVTTGRCYKYQYVVADRVGNAATYTSANVARVDTSGPRVTAITSQQANGTAGNGKVEMGDKLIITFNQALSTSGGQSFYNATITGSGSGNDLFFISGFTNGQLDTGSTAYVTGSGTVNIGLSPALVNNGTSTKVTFTVTSVSGAVPAAGVGSLVFAISPSVLGSTGSPANGTYTTASTFRLF
jgi:hypothetical protein